MWVRPSVLPSVRPDLVNPFWPFRLTSILLATKLWYLHGCCIWSFSTHPYHLTHFWLWNWPNFGLTLTVKLTYSELGYNENSVTVKRFFWPGRGLLYSIWKCTVTANSVTVKTRLQWNDFLAPESCFRGNMLGYNETNFFQTSKQKLSLTVIITYWILFWPVAFHCYEIQ